MPAAQTGYQHVVIGEDGIARVGKPAMKVAELVAEKIGWGMTPEQLLDGHPTLTLGQIYSALAYYSDHRDEIDRQIAGDVEFADRYRANHDAESVIRRINERR